MQILILCVLLTVMVAGAWLSGRGPAPEEPAARSMGELLAEAETAEHISRAVDALRAVMEHPELGGPGVLTVQFPAWGQPEVLAQYPTSGRRCTAALSGGSWSGRSCGGWASRRRF